MRRSKTLRIPFLIVLSGLFTALASSAEPSEAPIGLGGPGERAAVAAARFAGPIAYADAENNSVEIHDADGNTIRTISQSEIEALMPWAAFDAGPDGPCTLAWSNSGRRLYIGVFDALPASDGSPSDVVLLYDRYENALVRFARVELSADESQLPLLASVHHKGKLYVTADSGNIYTIPAGRNDATSTPEATQKLVDMSPVRGLAVDHSEDNILAASAFGLYRADLNALPLDFQLVTTVSNVRSLVWSSHYGGPGNEGLYFVVGDAGNTSIQHATPSQARGNQFFTPSIYHMPVIDVNDITARFDGSAVLAKANGASRLTDDTDTRLEFEQWIEDEFAQVLVYAKGLVSPDGEPSGWVIDADVALGGTRFHPATPDAACWTILMLLASDHLYNDPESQPMVREILNRYAGLSSTGPAPVRSADGFYQHWIDPETGATQAGWPFEYATYSTMKIVAAAVRASVFYPDDQQIQQAAREIVCGVSGWDGYFRPNNDEVYLIGQTGGGPQTSAWNPAFTEGIIFAEQANAFGGPVSANAWSRWINRNLWPTATFVLGRPVTGESPGSYLPGFITAYSLLLQPDFRANSTWQTHAQNVLVTHAAWSDENGPELFTVFSAGTTKPEWGGYNADSLSNHPGDVTTLPALMALAATGNRDVAASAYHAYRNGARENFATGASMLYRRSAIDPDYTPNTAGLPDVAMGVLGLAELIQPGTIDAVLAIETPPTFCDPPVCTADVNGDGMLSPTDFTAWIAAYNSGLSECDQNGDNACTPTDFTAWITNYNAGC